MQKNQINIHKFGGSSLANAERFKVVKSLLQGQNEVIVVSAMQGTTSSLQDILDKAAKKGDYLSLLQTLEKTHLDTAQSLLSQENVTLVTTDLTKDIHDIQEILRAVELMGSYSEEIQNLVLGYGEQWSAKILTFFLGVNKKVVYVDATQVLFIDVQHGNIVIDWTRSEAALHTFLSKNPHDQLVITGFIAATESGKRTTLGRNGSDYSAAIFARLLHANCLYIWTDVDGIYSADPRKVHAAFVIKALSYHEAVELAYFGAKVLHPKTIGPVIEDKIPIYIKNSYNPAAEGTYISALPADSEHPVKGLSSIENIALINIEGTGMIGVSGIASTVFEILHQVNVSVILISQASSEQSICFAIPEIQADIALKALTENLQFNISQHQIEKITLDKSCAIIAAVGDGMVGKIGIAGKLTTTLAKANINIAAIAQGSSERNISIVIKNKDVNKALRAIHSGFYLSNKTISIGLIGPGLIGKTLLKQILKEQQHLQENQQVNLYVRGIMNSRQMLLSHDPIDLNNWETDFSTHAVPTKLTDFINHITSDDMPHAVVIDCTASQDIANHYLDMIKKGMHVITPNKRTNSGDLDQYKKIKSLTQQTGRHYLYETTVCAGLPVINTLQELVKTGDEVIAIEGIVSGTLSFIFNELAKGKLFSTIIREAKSLGYTEPDPRDDLSGMDVARKLVCLGREIGLNISLSDVTVHDLVPEQLKNIPLEEFMSKLTICDDEMSKLVSEANAKGEKLCYLSAIKPDKSLYVGIQSFPENHPFGRLKGSDNMLIFHTKRYYEQPLVIQGPGAGAEVTAGGVFADLLRLVSYLS